MIRNPGNLIWGVLPFQTGAAAAVDVIRAARGVCGVRGVSACAADECGRRFLLAGSIATPLATTTGIADGEGATTTGPGHLFTEADWVEWAARHRVASHVVSVASVESMQTTAVPQLMLQPSPVEHPVESVEGPMAGSMGEAWGTGVTLVGRGCRGRLLRQG